MFPCRISSYCLNFLCSAPSSHIWCLYAFTARATSQTGAMDIVCSLFLDSVWHGTQESHSSATHNRDHTPSYLTRSSGYSRRIQVTSLSSSP